MKRDLPSRAGQWVRHHLAAAAATAVDFLVMVALVEIPRLTPAAATAVGAAAGAVTNFVLGRHWAYRRPDGGLMGQALRYALAAGGSLALNAGGVYLLAHRVGLQYVAARAITAVVVANAWNYPMQRFFVFGDPREGARPPAVPGIEGVGGAGGPVLEAWRGGREFMTNAQAEGHAPDAPSQRRMPDENA